jgi:hypothetical protein
MPSRKTLALAAALVLSVVPLSYGARSGTGIAPDQPLMRAARNQLEVALEELHRATNNQDGHRDNAIKLVQQAIAEVDLALGFTERNDHAGPGPAADQPYLESALTRLRNAKTKLEYAVGEKGGHRQKAVDLVVKAIGEVSAEIAGGN